MSFRFFTRSAAVVTGLFIAVSCSKSNPADDANLIAFNDYEAVIGWMPDPGNITREQAHSGHYAVKVDGDHEFGLGFGLPLSKAIARKPNKIRISAWAYMTDAKSTARLGLQLFDPAAGKEVFGDGIDFANDVKSPKKWVEISKEIKLPANTTSTQEMRVFLWRGGATSPSYMDDLRIELVD
jgi:hypothetical protein